MRRAERAKSLKYENATPGSASPSSMRYHSKRPVRLEDHEAASVLLPAPGSAAIQATPFCVAWSMSRCSRRRANQFEARGGDNFARRVEVTTAANLQKTVARRIFSESAKANAVLPILQSSASASVSQASGAKRDDTPPNSPIHDEGYIIAAICPTRGFAIPSAPDRSPVK